MRWVRDSSLRRANVIVTPSDYLAGVVDRWLGGPADVVVVPNGVRATIDVPEPTARSGLRVVFAGRLVRHKRVERLIEAVARTDGAILEVIGDGPEREHLEDYSRRLGAEVTFSGKLMHDEALRRIAAADALALASDYEGMPHVVLEALLVGTPVIAPAVGGVPEVVDDAVNGLILADADVETIAAAFRRLRNDPALCRRLSTAARRAGGAWGAGNFADDVLGAIRTASRRRPRLVMLGKTRFSWPLDRDLHHKLEVMVGLADVLLLNVGRPGYRRPGRVRVIVFPNLRPRAFGSALFYGVAPGLAVALAAGRRPGAVVCQSPYEGLGATALARWIPKSRRPGVVVEVHGDWRAATRLYGSRARRVLAPLADHAAAWALRRADRVRVIGDHTEELVRAVGYSGEFERFVTFGNLDFFFETDPVEVPEAPRALYVGALEATKSVDVLLEAWGIVRSQVPGSTLLIAGSGSRRAALERQSRLSGLDGDVCFLGAVSRERIRDLLDDALFLVLPSRSEGLGRVVLEAAARSRATVGTRVGGIPELVASGETGLLVDPDDPEALANALIGLLGNPSLCARMGRRARQAALARDATLDFAAGMRRLAAWVDTR
jgi:glycosyltransferase involved in cell wall biosynthesis